MESSLYELTAWAAFLGYLGLTVSGLRRDQPAAAAEESRPPLPIGSSGSLAEARRTNALHMAGLTLVLTLHGLTLLPAWFSEAGFRFGFASSVSWTLWLATLLLWVESFFQKLPRITALIFPVAAVGCLLPLWFEGVVIMQQPPTLFRAHILLAMLAYSAFAVAAAHALVMMSLENALHKGGRTSPWWDDMPALISLDHTLVRITWAGFVLLTFTLLSGVWVNVWLEHPPLRIDHKTFFTLATWVMVAVFFLGRQSRGWRGRVAAKFALAGFGLLLLAYVGSRFVLEVLLQR
jgi:ABC-type uncharacterized transport system permease subunit